MCWMYCIMSRDCFYVEHGEPNEWRSAGHPRKPDALDSFSSNAMWDISGGSSSMAVVAQSWFYTKQQNKWNKMKIQYDMSCPVIKPCHSLKAAFLPMDK